MDTYAVGTLPIGTLMWFTLRNFFVRMFTPDYHSRTQNVKKSAENIQQILAETSPWVAEFKRQLEREESRGNR